MLGFSPMSSPKPNNVVQMHQPINPTMSQTYQSNSANSNQSNSLKSSFKHLFLSTLSGQSLDDKQPQKVEINNDSVDIMAQT